jgi:hypothetical protein
MKKFLQNDMEAIKVDRLFRRGNKFMFYNQYEIVFTY